MSWESYEPLSATPRLEFTDDFDLLMGDSIGYVEDDGSYTSYHIANITPDGLHATLFNYSTEDFTNVSKDELHTWRRNDTPIDAALSIHEFTIQTDDSTIGIKFHGSAMQSKETIRFLGKDHFAYCLRLAIEENKHGNEITEPYYPETSVREDDYYEFEAEARTTLEEYLTENTPLTEDESTSILNRVLATFEHNAEQRVGVSEGWELPEALRDRLAPTNSESNISNLVSDFKQTPRVLTNSKTNITYHNTN